MFFRRLCARYPFPLRHHFIPTRVQIIPPFARRDISIWLASTHLFVIFIAYSRANYDITAMSSSSKPNMSDFLLDLWLNSEEFPVVLKLDNSLLFPPALTWRMRSLREDDIPNTFKSFCAMKSFSSFLTHFPGSICFVSGKFRSGKSVQPLCLSHGGGEKR